MTLPHKHIWINTIHGTYCIICKINKRKYDEITEMLKEQKKRKEKSTLP